MTTVGVLDRLLAYANQPWKAVVILFAVIIFGVGWFVWTERVRIADAVLSVAGQRAVLRDETFTTDAPILLRNTRGDLALLVEVDLNDNIMTDKIGIDQDGNRWLPSTGPQEALRPESSMPLLVQFLNNEVVCADTAKSLNGDATALSSKGYERMCMVSVPPILGIGVGALIIAWKKALPPAAEARADLVMKTAALKFASW
jgi:hypothetical protein